MPETEVRSLSREDPLEKEMTTHSSTLAWKIPWTQEPDRLQSMGLQRFRYNRATSLHFFRPKFGLLQWLSSKESACNQEMQETWVQSSLGEEDPLEEVVATHSSIFAWRIP